MEAGRELDARIYLEVMGYHNHENLSLQAIAGLDIPHYSTDIAAAWKVVDRLDYLGYVVSISQSHEYFKLDGHPVWVQIKRHTENLHEVFRANTAPEAICKAALGTVETPRKKYAFNV